MSCHCPRDIKREVKSTQTENRVKGFFFGFQSYEMCTNSKILNTL
jgi:hypothetical protein